MKTTRKKMLLSSIAMLLVALVALGSATYAWYANVTRVTAQSTSWNAAASTGLVIRHYDDNYTGSDKATQSAWKTALNTANGNALKTATSLSPRALSFKDSSGDAIAFSGIFGASGVADDRTSYVSSSMAKVADVASDNQYIVDQMYVAGEGGAETVSMSLTGSAATTASYLNLAVYVDGTLKEVFTSTSGATSVKNILNPSGTTISEDTTNTQDATAFTGASQRVGGDSFTFTAQPKDNGGTIVQIVAYVDGLNSLCKSNSVDTSTFAVNYQFDIA